MTETKTAGQVLWESWAHANPNEGFSGTAWDCLPQGKRDSYERRAQAVIAWHEEQRLPSYGMDAEHK